jgi:hypothetical protein
MNAADQRELEQGALACELAGQLRHDVGSFVYHISLQLDMLETLPDQLPDWAAIRREGKQLIDHLRELDQYLSSPKEPAEIDLNQLVQDNVRTFQREGLRSRITVNPASGSTLLVTRIGEARRLLGLLLMHATLSSRAADEKHWALSVETRGDTGVIQVKIRGVAPTGGKGLLDDEKSEMLDKPSLAIKTCRSLASRLDAKLRAEPQPDGKLTIIVEFGCMTK